MTRTWKMLVWTGKKYQEANCGSCRFEARSPKEALRIAGLELDTYDVKYSRKGYGYFTGRVEVRAPETVSAGMDYPLPADFLLLVVD